MERETKKYKREGASRSKRSSTAPRGSRSPGRGRGLAVFRRRIAGGTLALVAGVALCLAGAQGADAAPHQAATAGAIPTYNWVDDSTWTSGFTSPTSPELGASDTVGPGYLGNASGASAHMLGGTCATGQPCGGIIADLAQTSAGDYCNEYRLPVFDSNGSYPYSTYTGFSPDTPLSSYQQKDQTDTVSQQASSCQGESQGDTYGWGQWIQPADPGANCTDCGIHHYLSLVGTNASPWDTSFGSGPELTLQNVATVGAYQDLYTSGGAGPFAWRHMCAVLQTNYEHDGTYTSTPNDLELCADEWHSADTQGALTAETSPGQCGSLPGGGQTSEAIGKLDPSNPSGGYFTAITGNGQSGTITNGATGTWTFEATVTQQNLENVVNDLTGTTGSGVACKSLYSATPSDYKLVGIEDGIETGINGTTPANGYINYFGSSESELKAWTAY
jgi:hypothetical protein